MYAIYMRLERAQYGSLVLTTLFWNPPWHVLKLRFTKPGLFKALVAREIEMRHDGPPPQYQEEWNFEYWGD